MSSLTGQLLGNYRLVKHLGTGGFGEVYLGTHIHLRREAAIKLLLRLDEQEIAYFRNEAEIIARLVHPHIITLFDFDVAGEMPFIVMMYAPQGNLRTRYRPRTHAPLDEVMKYITQAARGLQFAHDQRVLHRDIKPANMLLGADEQLLLSDFGLAVMWSGTRSVHTKHVIGTHGYMAPEQFQGRPRPASDQYSLAITAYEWLSGARPMADAPLGPGMLQLAHPEIEIPPVRRVVPHLPPRVDEVLRRALSLDWQARFPSVREFAEELTRAATSSGPVTYSTYPMSSARPDTPFAAARPFVQAERPMAAPPAPPEVRSRAIPDTQPAGPHLHAPSDTTRSTYTRTAPAQFSSTSSAPIAPPPPPESAYSSYSDSASVVPPPPPGVKPPRPLALPVTRGRKARASWLWTIGYAAFLLIPGGALAGLAAAYTPTSAPAWLITLTAIDVVLLLLLATVLCGALLGKWRALLVSTFALGLTVLGVYLVLSKTLPSAVNSPSSGSWTGLLAYGGLPLSTFVVGWIYERRHYAHFGKSFLSMSLGLALLIILPIIVASLTNPTTSSTTNSAASSPEATIAGYLVIIWCLGVLLVFPLALAASGLEALMHMLAKKSRGASESS